jgi:hypothetical protein
MIIITRGWHNRPINGRSARVDSIDYTPHYTNLKKKESRLMVKRDSQLNIYIEADR